MTNILKHLDAMEGILRNVPFGLVSDIDGTISPIAPTPEQATVTPECRRLLKLLSQRLALVAVISGRSAMAARRMVGFDGLVYIGNHGLEWLKDDQQVIPPEYEDHHRLIAATVRDLKAKLDLSGISIEDKGFSVAVHYRGAADPDQARKHVLNAVRDMPYVQDLRTVFSRMAVDILPRVPVNKGTALHRLIEEYGLRSGIYLGDDRTDLDAFRALHRAVEETDFRGFAIAVTSPEMPDDLTAAANFTLGGISEVERFLEWLYGAAK